MPDLAPLPIDGLLPDIVRALEKAQCLVLEAPPGAGKTTRVPAALLRSRIAREGGNEAEVWVTEPRRLAARLAAVRVADELGEPVGRTVGYHVRFEDKASTGTRLRFLTEGVLLRRLLDDADARRARVVILDEFHERRLETDLCLSLLRRLQRKRPELRVVVMSATLDGKAVAAFLDDCPLVSSAGRAFPLEIEHQKTPDERPLERQIASAVRRCLSEDTNGDTLVFLPGAREIRRAEEALGRLGREQGALVLPLHGDMRLEDQARAIAPAAKRKVVLATNVAESSVTVPGVTRVIDTGLARRAVHSPQSGLSSLEITKISRAEANQRAGRAGRTGPGKVLRLFTRGDFESRPEAEKPEILRLDLSMALLTLHALGVPDAQALAWLTPPGAAELRGAEQLLAVLGAVDDARALTPAGRRLAMLPLHPRLGRLVAAGEALGVSREACRIAALLSERDIRLESRTSFAGGVRAGTTESGDSDAIELFDRFEEALAGPLSRERLRALELDANAVASVDRVAQRLERLARSRTAPPDNVAARDALLRRAVLAAFPDRVAQRRAPESDELVLANGTTARLSPWSVVHRAPLMVALEVASGGRDKARVERASAIEPEWLFEHPLVLKEEDKLEWNPEQERVERVEKLRTGVVVLEARRVPAPPSERATELLSAAARAKGIQHFDPAGELEALLARLETVARTLAAEGAPRGPADEFELLDRACRGRTSFRELREEPLVALVRSALDGKTLALLDECVPETIALPAGRRVKVHYAKAEAPWIASRLQDFFGMRKTPTLCRGRLPVTLHLLAPNQRAVQVTRDLEGFWQRHYPELRRALSRRYPKHAWPEDGLTATPKGNRRDR